MEGVDGVVAVVARRSASSTSFPPPPEGPLGKEVASGPLAADDGGVEGVAAIAVTSEWMESASDRSPSETLAPSAGAAAAMVVASSMSSELNETGSSSKESANWGSVGKRRRPRVRGQGVGGQGPTGEQSSNDDEGFVGAEV